jgi:protein O-mannosyl-transferase
MHITIKKIPAILAAAVILAAAAIYIPTLKSPFLWDDVQLITHPLNMGNNPYSFLFGSGFYYRPLLSLSMLTDYSFWHLNPMGYHLTNILLHAINSLLVFLVGFRLMTSKRMDPDNPATAEEGDRNTLLLSFFAAMFFALHPIHTESVAWVSGRTDILSTLFFLLAFVSFLEYAKERNAKALILSCLFFLFSLFSKENALSFIIVILAYGVAVRMPRKQLLVSLAALSVVIAVYIFLRQGGIIKMMLVSPGSKEAFLSSGTTPNNFSPQLSGAVGYYLEKLFIPVNLNLMPEIPRGPVYLLISLLPFVFGGILWLAGRRLEVFLIFWIIVTLLPSLLILFSQIAAPIGERYLYLPSAGFSIFLASILKKARKITVLVIIGSGILIAYSVSTHERLNVWKDEVSLWADTVGKSPALATPRTNYAKALIEINEIDKAKNELLIALKLKVRPDQTSSIYDLLGITEMKENHHEKAEEYLIKSLTADPQNSMPYNNLGVLYLGMSGGCNESEKLSKEALYKAIKCFDKALTISPGFIQPKFNLGLCYMKLGDFKKAESYFNSVIESDPRSKLANQSVGYLISIEFSRHGVQKGI